MRGHGLSDAPAGDYSIDGLVGDVAGLMDRLGFAGAVFVGLSIGGLVAQGLAAARPDLVRAVVLSNTAAKIGTEATWRERIGAVRAGGIEAIADGVMEKWFTPAFHAERADELAGWRHMLVRTPSTATSAPARRSPPPTCAPRPGRSTCRCWHSSARATARPRPTSCARPRRASPARLRGDRGRRAHSLRRAPAAVAALIGGFLADHDLV
jgi:pimeloyl-ACP methyl ester carboxylesterase